MSETANGMLNIIQVCNYIGTSPVTLNRWYAMQEKLIESGECPDMPLLPKYTRVGSETRGTKYWKEEDLEQFNEFLNWKKNGRAGKFGKFNAKYWGETGVKSLLNKGEIDEIRNNFSYFKNRIHDPELIERLTALGIDCSECIPIPKVEE